jgi:hypothetical protein
MISLQFLAEAARELADTFTGELLLSADPGFDEARWVHNGLMGSLTSGRAAIARGCGVAGVVDAVNFARRHGLKLAVRSAGINVSELI